MNIQEKNYSEHRNKFPFFQKDEEIKDDIKFEKWQFINKKDIEYCNKKIDIQDKKIEINWQHINIDYDSRNRIEYYIIALFALLTIASIAKAFFQNINLYLIVFSVEILLISIVRYYHGNIYNWKK